MKVADVPVGARLVDSYPFSRWGTEEQAKALAATGIDGFIGYLGGMTKARLAFVLAAGLAFMPVTYAGEYRDGAADELAQLADLEIPKGATVWLDLEGLDAWNADKAWLIGLLRSWALTIKSAGFIPGLYVGCPQPLSSQELYALPFARYWWGLGRCVDKTGALAEPTCGWCMIQQNHGQKNGMLWRDTGVLVDTNGAQKDYRGRSATWVSL